MRWIEVKQKGLLLVLIDWLKTFWGPVILSI